MKKILNIVNGDACIGMMKKAKIKGEFLAWRDFLHEGPVLTNLPLESLSSIRAEFIASLRLGTLEKLQEDFHKRDQKLASYREYEKITLWFEHDLYDQLQLIQILAWFTKEALNYVEITLICTNNYLGDSSIQQIQKLLHYETEVLPEHLQLAKKVWLAFGEKTPKAWFNLLNKPTGLLPFLKGAIFRMLQEYPNTKNGLSRTEYQALLIISNGIHDPLDIYTKYQSFEERKFMGDVIFFKILDNFVEYGVLKKEHTRHFSLTPLGKRLLTGHANWLSIKPIDRHIGGVHLTPDNLWCWDIKQESINHYYYSKPLNELLIVKKSL